ncbi:hypothetical protein [Actinoplanes sp. NPDC026670]|uniref:hypothetical protein n=1 Tax=Actinoplanes sp. NPDC026670 TaxID=3154700 RepID=UPI0033D9CDF1
MLTIRPVIEVNPWAIAESTNSEVLDDGPDGPTVRQPADRPGPWRVASLPAWSWLPLDGARTPAEVALFIAAVAASTHPAEEWPSQAVDRLLAAPHLIVSGGLQVHDSTTGVTITPGCCCGLETWREWLALPDGDAPWLGHDPTPTIQDLGPVLRLWQNAETDGRHVDIPRAALRALLEQAHRDLNDFLLLTGAWAITWTTSRQSRALTAALDRGFAVTAPLEFPCDTATLAPPTRPGGPALGD